MENSEIVKHLKALYDGVIEAQYACEANSVYLSSLLRTSSAAYHSEAIELSKKLKLSQEKLRSLRSQLSVEIYSAPYMTSVVPFGEDEDLILTANKPVVVLVAVILEEGRDNGDGIKPTEECPDGMPVLDIDHPTKHEFDTVEEALEFAKRQVNPDRNPMSVDVYEFHPESWKKIAVF